MTAEGPPLNPSSADWWKMGEKRNDSLRMIHVELNHIASSLERIERVLTEGKAEGKAEGQARPAREGGLDLAGDGEAAGQAVEEGGAARDAGPSAPQRDGEGE